MNKNEIKIKSLKERAEEIANNYEWAKMKCSPFDAIVLQVSQNLFGSEELGERACDNDDWYNNQERINKFEKEVQKVYHYLLNADQLPYGLEQLMRFDKEMGKWAMEEVIQDLESVFKQFTTSLRELVKARFWRN